MDPNQMGAAGQPMPNQPTPSNMPEFGPQPVQAAQPVQPMAEPVAEPMANAEPMAEQVTMTMEEQMAAAMQEPMMQQQMPQPEPMPVEAPKKKGHGMLITMILALIVAAGGIGFGVYMLISGQQTENNYKRQISTLQGTIAQLQEAAQGEVDAEGNPISPSDYFYFPDLGVKVKKSADWQNTVDVVEYTNGYPQATSDYAIRERNTGADAAVSNVFLYAQCTETSNVCIEIDGTKFGITVGPNVTESFSTYYTNADNYSLIK